MNTTPYDLDELRRLEKESTPGEWRVWPDGKWAHISQHNKGNREHYGLAITGWGAVNQRLPDASLIVALRNAAAAGMLERMAKLEAVAELSRQLVVSAILVGPTLYYDANRLGAALHALDALTTKEPRDRGDQGRVDDCVKAFRDQFVKKELR